MDPSAGLDGASCQDAQRLDGVRVATFQEVADGLDRVAGKSDEVVDALVRAGRLAAEAVEMLTAVAQGAGHLEYEFDEVVQHWSTVAHEIGELVRAVTAGRRRVERHRESLNSDLSRTRAHPDSPPGLTTSARVRPADACWIEQQRAVLPTYVTSGFFRDDEGNSDLVQSGDAASEEVRAIARHVAELGLIRPGSTPWVASHVEAKVAWRMREATAEHVEKVELVINNVICQGDLACEELLPDILLPGQTLVVHDLRGTRTFHGRGLT